MTSPNTGYTGNYEPQDDKDCEQDCASVVINIKNCCKKKRACCQTGPTGPVGNSVLASQVHLPAGNDWYP